MLLNLNDLIKDALCPPVCAVCGKVTPMFVCKDCLSIIDFLGDNICGRCGNRLLIQFDKKRAGDKICSLCGKENFYFYKARSYSVYDDTVAEIIKKYKYKKQIYLEKVLLFFFHTAFYHYYHKEKFDYIETVPDYNPDLLLSGYSGKRIADFNHMQILAEQLGRYLKIPYSNNIIKLKQTLKQQKLDRDLRKFNIKGAFKVKNCLEAIGRNYLLIDDVFTTGSTLNEISRVLKNAGADKIYVLTISRRIQVSDI